MRITSHRFAALAMATGGALALAGCGGHHAMHHMHHGGMGPKAAPTAPAKVSTSTPTLTTGYQKVAAAPEAKVYFVNLSNGATVSNPVKIVFGLTGMGVAPAGIEKAGTGHHHLLVNVAEWDANNPLPANDNFRHFGLGQTETTVTLPAGTHTLQMVMADQNHIPHHPVVASERITITVK